MSVFDLINKEKERQDKNIELIASENFVSDRVLAAVGSILTNKYAEGYPNFERTSGNRGRYYGGCEYIDQIEEYCCDKWREVFNTDYHVNVQPHSGSSANFQAYSALLNPGDTILSLSLDNGGHLSHGSKANFSSKFYNVVFYNCLDNGLIDYLDIYNKMVEYKPKLILAGASAYSRTIDFELIKEIINRAVSRIGGDYQPYFMVDMAHIAGLIAAGVHPTPFGLADIITTTTQKTLRGPRGGLIFCKPELAKKVDSAVFPFSQGGPLMHVIAGKAVCAEEALTKEYKEYIKQVVHNSKIMANYFKTLGVPVVTNGTNTHMFLLDLSPYGITGLDLQNALDKINITLNKNAIPNDKLSPKLTSGVRIGTAAMTTKGYTADDFIKVAQTIYETILSLQAKQ